MFTRSSHMHNTKHHYGVISRSLHWLMATLIPFLFLLGLYMVDLNYYDDWYHTAPSLHKSLGIILATLLLFRIIWMFFQIKPVPLVNNKQTVQLISLVHISLLLLLVITVISGYLISTADGRSIVVFGLFDVPATLSHIKNQEDMSGEIHFYVASSLIVIASLHALFALIHHFIYKDNTLRRMLGVKQIN